MSNLTQKRISFELNIKSVRVDLPTDTPITVFWVRGINYNKLISNYQVKRR
jgi:hypothetical protein